MAHTIRSLKSGNGWTNSELVGFNIQIHDADTVTFFNTPDLPSRSNVSSTILNNVEVPQGPLTKNDRLFFHYLRDAVRGEESMIDDFVAFILGMLEYDEPDRIIRRRKDLSFVMCGQTVNAQTDVCVTTSTDILLLVQGDKKGYDPEPQLIAEAIAAFYQNNRGRALSGRPPLASKVFPGITMIGAVPIFYRIPTTAELVRCIETATYPPQATIVQRFVPLVPNLALYMVDGLVPLENRRIVMQCFEAFKVFVTEE
ncbi:uncharacterized protein EV420DRAFT_1653919 [Desarmillaria tabescens]|uniref:Uncharacterized protein n=1 Tax=Armillaria tabescens TaxID=1929756 RepID=A0AA39J1S5_ARMTA|nr:uncharacterized protein EV420DRAFT_1653919 [Desarmillaria tabescens]KAK0434545.1 hypothetical protein EV420DRAFT_1653919 [Desarmillaria tabescens]